MSRFDCVPSSEGDATETLNKLFTICWQWSSCIDYVQLGNEMLGGGASPPQGTMYFYPDQLGQGDPGGMILDIDPNYYGTAFDLLTGWFDRETRAIVYGSALGGRPLRVYLPAMTIKQTIDGGQGVPDGPYTDPDNRRARALRDLIEFANRNQAIFDQHMRYEQFSQVSAAWGELLNSNYWSAPDQVGVLETAPDPSTGWLTAQRKQFIAEEYYWLEGENPPWCTDGSVAQSWNSYLDNVWENQQYDPDGFMITGPDGLFAQHANNGALHALYGNAIQGGDTIDCGEVDKWHVLALHASKFHHVDDVGNSGTWTILRDRFEAAVSPYVSEAFDPHHSECECVSASIGN